MNMPNNPDLTVKLLGKPFSVSDDMSIEIPTDPEAKRLKFIEDIYGVRQTWNDTMAEGFTRFVNAGITTTFIQALAGFSTDGINAAENADDITMEEDALKVNKLPVYLGILAVTTVLEGARMHFQNQHCKKVAALTDNKISAGSMDLGAYLKVRLLQVMAEKHASELGFLPTEENLPQLLAEIEPDHSKSNLAQTIIGFAGMAGNIISNRAQSDTSNGQVSVTVMVEKLLERNPTNTKFLEAIERVDTTIQNQADALHALTLTADIIDKAVELREITKAETARASEGPVSDICKQLNAGASTVLSSSKAFLVNMLYQGTENLER
jgi:hypothetical protein